MRAELDYVAALRDLPARGARLPRSPGRSSAPASPTLADRRIGVLSRGTRQRVGLAVALVGDPPALLLDEPTAGMDPTQSADMRHLIRSLGSAHAVFVSSHALADVETLCDRVIVLRHGRVLAEGAPAELAARLRPVDPSTSMPPRPPRRSRRSSRGRRACVASSALPAAAGRARCRVETRARRASSAAALAARVTAAGWPLYALRPSRRRSRTRFSPSWRARDVRVSKTLVIARRELASMFGGPLAWVLGAVFALLTGYFFYSDLTFYVLFGGANLTHGLWRYVFLDFPHGGDAGPAAGHHAAARRGAEARHARAPVDLPGPRPRGDRRQVPGGPRRYLAMLLPTLIGPLVL